MSDDGKPGDRILSALLERLYLALSRGPALNCSPGNSRQRLDFALIERLGTLAPPMALGTLLGDDARVVLRPEIEPLPPPPPKDVEEDDDLRHRRRIVEERKRLVKKLGTIAAEADNYLKDTGSYVLYLGYPILSLPDAPSRSGRSPSRILAPITFTPISLSVSATGRPSIQMACLESGTDRLVANIALRTWLERQLNTTFPDLFQDEEGGNPLREITEITNHLAAILEIPHVPDLMGWPVQRVPEMRDLAPAPAILPSAVLGLYQIRNQSIIRDMETLRAAGVYPPTINPFLTLEDSLVVDRDIHQAEEDQPTSLVPHDEEFLVDRADPCQRRAVIRARHAQGLVVHGPPGTGKSQTISNIIGDQLARGKRVLLVCEKRTALDVVKYRLDGRDLGHLCAVVHDATHDRSPLFMGLRDRLENLADAPVEPDPSRQIRRVNEEMGRIDEELHNYYVLLTEHDAESGESFHQLAGHWLQARRELGDHAIPELPATADDINPEPVLSRRGDIERLYARLHQANHGENGWESFHGLTLDRYLSLSVLDIQSSLAKCIDAARVCRERARTSQPPYRHNVDLSAQGTARQWLAAALTTLLAEVPTSIRAAWKTLEPPAREALLRGLPDHAPHAHLISNAPLAADLLVAHNFAPWPISSVVAAIPPLAEYIAECQGFLGFLKLGVKKRARAVLTPMGLPLSIENATKAKAFLEGLQARYTLRAYIEQRSGATITPGTSDAELVACHAQLDNLRSFLSQFESQSHASPFHSTVIENISRDEALRNLAEDLAGSEAQVRSLLECFSALVASRLFSANAIGRLRGKLLHGGSIVDDLEKLRDDLDYLEPWLRFEAESVAWTPAVGETLKALYIAGFENTEAWHALIATIHLGSLRRRLRQHPELQRTDAARIESHFNRLAQLTIEKHALVARHIRRYWQERQREQLLSKTGSRLNAAGTDLRRRLMLRGRNASRIRETILRGHDADAQDPIFDMHPVWMTSPETASQIFPLEPIFDIVIFDEASQCRLEEGIPVLARARGVVISGDIKQLPPTRFFESSVITAGESTTDDDSDDALFQSQQSEIEDLLSAALNIEIEQSFLDVHYRSTTSELIDYSNAAFYGERLQAIPGHPNNRRREPAISLHHVDGIYENRTNPAEADHIVEIVRGLLQRDNPPSIGIVTFNLTQKDLVDDKLDEAAEADIEFRQRLDAARNLWREGSFEGLFVKNLENVQGDERDYIIISTTYGRDANGRFYRRFGPLGRSGGERRLNVIVTRARHRVEILTSIPPEIYRGDSGTQIPAGKKANGAWHLMSYLRHAEELQDIYALAKNRRAREETTNSPATTVEAHPTHAPSPFVEAFARILLHQHGISSTLYYGNDGFCIDVSFRHPRHPDDVTIGIIFDSTRFPRAQDPVEWDCFRRTILLGQRWDLKWVWTPHFLRDPEGTVKRLVDAARAYEQVPTEEA